APEPGVPGRDRQRLLGRDPVRSAAPALAAAGVAEARGGGGAVSSHPARALTRGGSYPGQPELRGVEAGPEVHGGAHEGRPDVSPVRVSDQPDRFEPGDAELLPGRPASI